jgi:DNA invertase Pin-like site-specific DNA recombinase
MLIGYARVSTYEQTLNLQRDALEKAGCTKIFTDTASGAQTEKRGWKQPSAMSETVIPWLSGD